MEQAARERVVSDLARALGYAADVTPAPGQPVHVLLAAMDMPETVAAIARSRPDVWAGWPAQRPQFLIDKAVVGESGDLPRSHSLVYQLGEPWTQPDGGPAETTELVSAGRLDGRPVLDVLQDAEYAAGHVPGAVHIELGGLPGREQAVPGGAVVMCGHGERAMTAASLLQAAGHRGLSVLAGGPQDWAAAPGRRPGGRCRRALDTPGTHPPARRNRR